jgi:hypothetical protein
VSDAIPKEIDNLCDVDHPKLSPRFEQKMGTLNPLSRHPSTSAARSLTLRRIRAIVDPPR